MTGALWAVIAGLGFGVFQTVNRRAIDKMDVFVATFLQLATSAIVLGAVCVATEDVSALGRAPFSVLISFGLAGLIHFSLGWTFLNASQKQIGAARTSALIGTSPLFGALLAFITLSESIDIAALAGIAFIMAGVYFTHNLRGGEQTAITRPLPESRWRTLAIPLAAPLCWSISPIFIRLGLQGLASPLLGVTVGMIASALGYGAVLALRGSHAPLLGVSPESLMLKIAAGVMVGLSTWARWVALELTTVAAVLALSLVSVPTVNLLTPVVIDRRMERVTTQVWLGSALIVGGSLVLILLR